MALCGYNVCLGPQGPQANTRDLVYVPVHELIHNRGDKPHNGTVNAQGHDVMAAAADVVKVTVVDGVDIVAVDGVVDIAAIPGTIAPGPVCLCGLWP